jgi:hypothetical protein
MASPPCGKGRIILPCIFPQKTEDNVFLIHDWAKIQTKLVGMLLRLSCRILQATPWNLSFHLVDHHRRIPLLSFHWQAIGQPVDFSRFIIKYLLEAQAFEPPRGSWTQVSLIVVAINDDRPVFLQFAGRLLVERLKWNVDGLGKMPFLIL